MSWTDFTTQTATASDARGNFQHIWIGSLLPHGGSTSFAPTTGVYDLGQQTIRWDSLFMAQGSSYVDGTATFWDGSGVSMTVAPQTTTGGISSITTLILGKSATVIQNGTTTADLAGWLGTGSSALPYYRKVTTTTLSVGASTIAHATITGIELDNVIFMDCFLHAASGRRYSIHSKSPTTTLDSGIAWRTATAIFVGGISSVHTVTIMIDYFPTGLTTTGI